MKTPVIILCVVSAGLGFGWYKSSSGATQQAETMARQNESLSNQVAELRTRLALEHGTGAQVQSNLQFIAQQRIVQLLNTSNRLIQTHLLLKSAHAEAQDSQLELQNKVARIAVLESQYEELKGRLEALPPLHRQVAEAKDKLVALSLDREKLLEQLQRLQFEKAEWMSKLGDASFLRLQLARAEEDAEARLRLAKAGKSAPVDKKARLELKEDGTVRPVLSANTQAPK